MGEPGGLPSMGSQRVGHDWSDLAAAAAVIWRVKDRLRFPLRHSDLWARSSQWLEVCPWSGRLVLRALSSWSQTHVSRTWPKDKKWDTKSSLEQDVRLRIINEGRVQIGPHLPPILEVTRTLTLSACHVKFRWIRNPLVSHFALITIPNGWVYGCPGELTLNLSILLRHCSRWAPCMDQWEDIVSWMVTMLGLMIWAEVESSMLLSPLSAPGCLLRPSTSVILGVHLLSENENPRSVTRVWSSSPIFQIHFPTQKVYSRPRS